MSLGPEDIRELPLVVEVKDQPCQQLYEGNPVLLGYDVVQYHFIPSYRDGGVAVRGKPEHAYNFQGYQFWFSTEQNRKLFVEDPWKYAPAWGGFCSWGIARELPPSWPWAIDFLGPPASPWNGWIVVDGVLVFNIWASYSDRFLRESDMNMALAAKRWSDWFGNGEHRKGGPFNTHCIGHGPLQNWCLSRQPSPWLEDLPTCTVEDSEGNVFVDEGIADQEANAISTFVGTNTSKCTDVVLSGGLISPNCSKASINISGGGVVSTADHYSDFGNARFTPHQQRMFIVAFTVGFVALVGLIVAFCYRKRIKQGCARCFGRKDETAAKGEVHEASGSEGTESDGAGGRVPPDAENGGSREGNDGGDEVSG